MRKTCLGLAAALAAAIVLAAGAAAVNPAAPTGAELARWRAEAQATTITRDDWGIAHVHGKTDADAVFGMEYAQAEDDFHRVEMNYVDALGRRAEAEGAGAIWRDLRMKLFVDPAALERKYAASPAWLRRLMDAFADGLNYYLYTHPNVHPEVIAHYEPWMALAFSEGSIGGDIERVNLRELAKFYGAAAPAAVADAGLPPEPTGSNGIAISPKITRDHHALLWINPHTSFYFRSELQMTSDEGLDAYGAVTWGNFFVYQGFNPGAGWMHTSSGVDNIDWFLETVAKRDGRMAYRHGGRWLAMRERTIVVPYRAADGTMARRTFTGYYTMHGPIVARVGAKWESISLMQRPMRALIQDFTRTEARDYAAYRKTMELHTNSSNNTIFADREGNIAYWHSDYIPRRDNALDWTQPVDGSNPDTDYHGLLTLAETPHLLNPGVGWLYNSNNWPWSAAGTDSPRRQNFPKYVERGTEESPRGYHALRLLTGSRDWTMPKLIDAGFDSYLPAFAHMLPRLFAAYDGLAASDPLKQRMAAPMAALRGWNDRWGAASVATSLAVFWGTEMARQDYRSARAEGRRGISVVDFVRKQATPRQLVGALAQAVGWLTHDFGTWRTPWGAINRFQRINDNIEPSFDDAKPSIPVPFPSSQWGSLASFGARPYPNTKKWYGSSGNSFVCVVEFGRRVEARAVTAGGESGDPHSPHFDDEAERYASGNLRQVYFWPDELKGHIERVYHPGQ